MTHCDLTYGEAERGHNETKVIENFLPQHRSFNLHPLQVQLTLSYTTVVDPVLHHCC
jgi:hypothetical protein